MTGVAVNAEEFGLELLSGHSNLISTGYDVLQQVCVQVSTTTEENDLHLVKVNHADEGV